MIGTTETAGWGPAGRRWAALAALALLALVWPRTAVPALAQAAESRHLAVSVNTADEVVVAWRDTPGNGTDWVSVVRAGTPDDVYESTWTYTSGHPSGAYIAGRLAAGDYEARLYLNWPSGGYLVADRVYFRVGGVSGSGLVESRHLQVSVSATGEVIAAWRDTPGGATDWVSVVRAGAPDDVYESTWTYTNGRSAGTYNAGRLAAGEYEVRLYLNWPAGGYLVVDRIAFRLG